MVMRYYPFVAYMPYSESGQPEMSGAWVKYEDYEKLYAELAACESFHKVAVAQRDAAWKEIERLKGALHQISLASQNSMSTKEECGCIARKAMSDALDHILDSAKQALAGGEE
jgi:hypothetical protein